MCDTPYSSFASDHARTGRTILLADAAVDAMGTTCCPAAVVLDGDQIEALDTPQAIGEIPGVTTHDWTGHVLLPGLVNAHTHLDLSGPGPWPREADFLAWIGRVRSLRSETASPADAVTRGVALARAGGTVAVGDIVGHPSDASLDALANSGLHGLAFIEGFGLGTMQASVVERFASRAGQQFGRMRAGFSPHAPYSCGPDVFAGAALLAGGVSTHIAETPEELELLAGGTGPFRAVLMDDVGLPEEALPNAGVHPIDLLIDHLAGALCVHLNCIEPRHAEALASVGAVACLCPRATAYFGRDVPGPFDMLREAGVEIVLGTDALLCLDTPDRICMLDEARFLFGLGAASALDLLAMITTGPADALSVDGALVDLRSGPTAGILAVPGASLDDAMSGTDAPQWAAGPF